ncbi:MAG: helix-turn-helix transcriptional regulator [Bacilli bacterium]
MEISQIITKRRKELHMTQRELAEKLNVTDKTVSRWEVGKSYPDATILPALAKALNVSIDELFGDTSKVVLSTNEEDKVDHKQMTKFKIYNIVSLALLVTGIVIFSVNLIVNIASATNTTFTALLVLSILLMIGSVVLMVVGTMLYKAFYKEKFYTKVYKKELAKLVIGYVSTFVVLLSLISMIFMIGIRIFISNFILIILEIVMAIIFEKNGYNLSVKNRKIYYIVSGVICMFSILAGLLGQFYMFGFFFSIILMAMIVGECVLTFRFYGFKTVIKE